MFEEPAKPFIKILRIDVIHALPIWSSLLVMQRCRPFAFFSLMQPSALQQKKHLEKHFEIYPVDNAAVAAAFHYF